MSEAPTFHGNMVIWATNDTWDGFGFFGQSVHGKSPFSFALAQKLIESGHTVKIFDDRFRVANGRIVKFGNWGDPDLLGFYESLLSTLGERNIPFQDLHPRDREPFPLRRVSLWLLLFTGEEGAFPLGAEQDYRVERCPHADFVQLLVNIYSDLEDLIRERLESSWRYYKVTRRRQIDYPLQQKLIRGSPISEREEARIGTDRDIIEHLTQLIFNCIDE